MKEMSDDTRRTFLKSTVGTAAGLFLLPKLPLQASTTTELTPGNIWIKKPLASRIKFAVIGMNHGHIYGQVEALLQGGGELVSYYAKEKELADAFGKRYPKAKLAREENEILEDPSIQLVTSAGIPNERGPLGIRVMKAGKDYMSDKPAITSLKQLAEIKKVQKETKRIFSIMYGERLGNRATVKAGELVKAGAIGKVIQTIGMGPHRMSLSSRPEWFFDKAKFGGILCDIASHQFDQFLYFTNSTSAKILASQAGNTHHPQYPKFEDFGDAMVQGNGGSGYIRVDWFTPDGLKSWGDGRLTVLGTDGYLEIRKNVDIAGRDGGNHLFLVDNKETRYIDSSDTELSYGRQLVDDVLNRTETAMTHAHCFLATELALIAQKNASTMPQKG
ncbi:putative dehydrogenase [Dyadobacter jejuensis]|uniref:Putative dehydrogenase n=1 Tax=Dyadobacter jejuensis TaxID=1082580 RepID=A0A316ALZ1_9BACT|nr:Gfo/Idh/MocA family oxidoreductase [Dyadobacter jejuensis]PWJ58805.1 putative dehydrogenase [Dyadobacter jejuensis]